MSAWCVRGDSMRIGRRTPIPYRVASAAVSGGGTDSRGSAAAGPPAFGGPDRVREDCRQADAVQWLDNAWRDLKYALRTLRSSPLFTGASVLSLALGIGANSAVFTLLYASLWKPLPVKEPGQIVHLMRSNPRIPAMSRVLLQAVWPDR